MLSFSPFFQRLQNLNTPRTHPPREEKSVFNAQGSPPFSDEFVQI